jgi:hypothetical protein
MIRSLICTLALVGFVSAASADELDKEFTAQSAPAPSGVTAVAPAGSELDQESPTQACHWRGGWGYGSYYGYGGYSPIGFGYYGGFSPSFYSYRSFGYSPFYSPRYYSTGFYGGLGGFGYSSFYGYRGFGPRWGGFYW